MNLNIKNGYVESFAIGNYSFPLKKKIKLSEAGVIEQVANFFDEYVDSSDVQTDSYVPESSARRDEYQWTPDELKDFLDKSYSKRQKIFLKELSKKPERLTKTEVKEAFEKEDEEMEPYTMAGILSCFSRRRYNYGKKEVFWISEWDPREEDQIYMLKEQYRKIFEEYFKEE